ncbi:MAG: TIGR03790 family protein [Planctomycetota bacterium]|jgi:uncharacterized protein (TIGR03790 family)
MTARTFTVILLVVIRCGMASALEPGEILIIANGDVPESGRIARYYCDRRGVPRENIFRLSLGARLSDTIGRKDYDTQLAQPIRSKFLEDKLLGKIKCLLTIYGVPTKVGGRGALAGQEDVLKGLKESADREKKLIEELEQKQQERSRAYKLHKTALARLQLKIDRINGRETSASVDSELSMVLFESYDLYRWQPNELAKDSLALGLRTLMVSRLDGPSPEIARGLVDKSMAAEKTGLKGTAYIDSRGLKGKDLYCHFDRSLRNLAAFTRSSTQMRAIEEATGKLFAPGSCPEAAIYCGWYSLRRYVDAFDFVDGAIGYHIASFEAVNLRDPNSGQWCPSLLKDGIAATLGPVAEPYLHSFPEPRAFFAELYEGRCLVEAYYRTKPFNSWQLLLVGDPLYIPFKNAPAEAPEK